MTRFYKSSLPIYLEKFISNFQTFILEADLVHYHKALNLGCCSSPRSASAFQTLTKCFSYFIAYWLGD